MRTRRRFAPIKPAPPPSWLPPPPPEKSPEEIAAYVRSVRLREAAEWGYDPEHPETLQGARERLLEAMKPDSRDQYRDRADPLAHRRAETRNTVLQFLNQEAAAMKITDAFPSSYLKASDLNGRSVKVTVSGCELEDLDGEHKPVLRFQGKQKGMVLNRTNAGVLAAALGEETSAWAGHEVELYPDRTMFQGRMVDCLRLRVPTPAAAHPVDNDIPW